MNEIQVIQPRLKDLGGFSVRRALPFMNKRSVGPFVFFDEMGPSILQAETGIDVRPHPHIGLSTLTYLFEGCIRHRDSLGVVQDIRPGDVNWMTAGKGVVHSERSPEDERKTERSLHGIQVWVALPKDKEEVEPSFVHYPAQEIPLLENSENKKLTLVAGKINGIESPVSTFSPLFYIYAQFNECEWTFASGYSEQGIYLLSGEMEVGSRAISPGELAILPNSASESLKVRKSAKAILFGGEPLEGERFIDWNFVSSRRERIEEAKTKWKAGAFPTVPGESEFIPLPE